MASITTIADELGISPSTVSRALQRPQMVSAKTRHAVLQAAKKQGYLDKLNKDKGNSPVEPLIGVLVADLSNSFSGLIVKSIQDQAYLRNYSVVVGCTYEQPALEKQILKQWEALDLKGIVAMPSQGFCEAYGSLNSDIPLVLVDRTMAQLNCDSVIVDDCEGMEQIIEHLLSLSHENIVLLSGNRSVYTFKERAQAALAYANVKVIDINAVKYEELYMGAFEQTSILMLRPKSLRPTALIGANNAITAGILYALNLKGIKVADDISVVSYGDSEWCRFYPTPVTSIRQPIEEMATTAANLLFDRINGNLDEFKQVKLAPMLLARASTALLTK